MRKRILIYLWILAGLAFQQAVVAQAHKNSRYSIIEAAGEWQLLRDGQSFYIKGAVGWQHFDVLNDCGANSVRTRASKRHLDLAHEYGLVAMAGLPVRGERNGMDWDNEDMVIKQKQRLLQTVMELKEHPALMFWAVGNELDWIPPGKPHNPRLWEHLNELALEIRKIDPNHPVLTVVGTGRFEQKVQQIAKLCPDFDLLGINTYGDIAKVTELTRRYWSKPYVIAEWGPTGHWQVPKTPWRVPIEQTSTEKAQVIFDRYTKTIQPNHNFCLGSYVFLWGQKQETTHTWYGMFRDGLKTESIDVMKYLWTGSWPENRAPAVLNLNIEGFTDKKQIYLGAGKVYFAIVTSYDSDYDVLTFVWNIRPEVQIPAGSYAGGLEKPAKPIPGLIKESQGPRVHFIAPTEDGPYRIFVEIYDGQGHAGYGNIPFYVKSR